MRRPPDEDRPPNRRYLARLRPLLVPLVLLALMVFAASGDPDSSWRPCLAVAALVLLAVALSLDPLAADDGD